MKKKTKIWVGVGAFVLVGGGAMTAPGMLPAEAGVWNGAKLPADFANDPAYRCAPSNLILAQAVQGGEGEAGPTELPPDIAFARIIALVRGHLLIGDLLVKEKQWNAAFPHFLHPTEELYDAIKNDLKDYGSAQFDGALKKLAATVKARNLTQYTADWKTVDEALTKVEAAIKSKQNAANWTTFTLHVALEAIRTSASEYGMAVEKKRITKPVEYQDARGFILHSEGMIAGVAADIEKRDAEALKRIRSGFADLKAIFPTAMPPKSPIKPPSAVASLISRVELAAGPLL